MVKILASLIAVASTSIGCTIAPASSTADYPEQSTETVDSFPLPSVPATLTTPAERAEYLVTHFFDQVILPDSVTLGLEQAIANYTTVAHLASDQARATAAKTLYSRAKDDSQREAVSEVADKYLFSAGSPFFDLDLFIPFVEAQQPSTRRNELLRLSSLNRTGSTANDIPLIKDNGESTSLYDAIGSAAFGVLFFFDPDCDLCHDLARTLAHDKSFNDGLGNGKIAVIAVAPGIGSITPPDFMPAEWTAATDREEAIEADDLYFIPSIPEVYIIDGKTHTVISRGITTADSVIEALRL